MSDPDIIKYYWLIIVERFVVIQYSGINHVKVTILSNLNGSDQFFIIRENLK